MPIVYVDIYFPSWQKANLIIQLLRNIIKKNENLKHTEPHPQHSVSASCDISRQLPSIPTSYMQLRALGMSALYYPESFQLCRYTNSHISQLKTAESSMSLLHGFQCIFYLWFLVYFFPRQIKNRNPIMWLHTVHVIIAKLVSSRPQNN